MSSTRRAPRSHGARTTLRVPAALATTVDQLANQLDISRNDALLRLAARGASAYEREQRIAEIREQRWAAVLSANGEPVDFPSAEEAQEAVLGARGGPN